MEKLNKGDKVKYIGETTIYFISQKTYIISSISPTYIGVIDETGTAYQFKISAFHKKFSVLTTLQVPKCSENNKSEDVRSYNVGQSDYSKHKIQPWDIWLEYNLNPWDADIVKRILRTKETDSRKLDYEKIIHICKERIRQLDLGYK